MSKIKYMRCRLSIMRRDNDKTIDIRNEEAPKEVISVIYDGLFIMKGS